MNKAKLLSLIIALLIGNIVIAQTIQRPKNNCSSLREKGENYGVGDDNKSYCDFEKQTPYVDCQCKWENALKRYEEQINSIKNEISKLSSQLNQVYNKETSIASKGTQIWYNLSDDDPNFKTKKTEALSNLKQAIIYAEEKQKISKNIESLRNQIYGSDSFNTSKSNNIENYRDIISRIENKTQSKHIKIISNNEGNGNTNTTLNSNKTNNQISSPQSRLDKYQKITENHSANLRQQEAIDKAYQDDIQNAISESFDNEGNFNAGVLINSLPTATTKTQAYSNLIMSGTAILGQLLQSTPSVELEIERRKQQLKDGVGRYDSNNNKTGHWTYFYMNTTSPKSSGSYKNGKQNGIWEYYKNQEYSWAMDKIMTEVVVFDNGKTKQKHKAKNVNYSITRETGLFSKKKKIIQQKGNYLIESGKKIKYGLWEQYNDFGVNISTGYYNIKGEKTGLWLFGYEFQKNGVWYARKYKLSTKINYKKDKPIGKQITYKRNGEISCKIDSESGERECYENNKVIISESKKTILETNKINKSHFFKRIKLDSVFNKKYGNLQGVQYKQLQLKPVVFIEEEKRIISKEDEIIYAKSHSKTGLIFHKIHFVKLNGKYGVINSKDQLITNIDFDSIITPDFARNKLIVEKKSYYGVLNNKGKLLTKINYNKIGLWGSKYWVMKDSKIGLIDNNEKIILPIDYDYIEHLKYSSNNKKRFLGRIMKNKKWGFVNYNGKIIIEPIYDYIKRIEKNKIEVSKNGEKYYINFQGKRIKNNKGIIWD